MDFFADPPPILYLALLLAALVCGALWLRTKNRGMLVGTIAVLVLLLALFLYATFTESPREQAVREVNEMAKAISDKNFAAFDADVSESFDFKGMKKKDIRRAFDLAVGYNVRATAWEFTLAEGGQNTPNAVDVEFDAKLEGPGGEPFLRHFRASFVKDADGKLRMKGFTPYKFATRPLAEDPLPGVP